MYITKYFRMVIHARDLTSLDIRKTNVTHSYTDSTEHTARISAV